jgi:diaminohydroxyphosphoribosylaminopyrimidine deaminase/5-amino-6-(5-phosphoribosylamino)uracil reductase
MKASWIIDQDIPVPKRWEPMTLTAAMRLAVSEAFKGAGFTEPNPLVGCVVLDSQNRFLSRGFHRKIGGAHAEVEALKNLSAQDLKGAKVIVTLEPCAHEGRTGSCAKMLASLGVDEVVFGLIDPNPKVSGQGVQILKAAGKKVSSFIPFAGIDYCFEGDVSWTQARIESWRSILEQTCEHFLVNQAQKRAFVSLKVASSLDGQMALQSGESQWITSPMCRQEGHYLRAFHQATLVGSKTLIMDDPQLNVRHPEFPNFKNKAVVLNQSGEILKSSNNQKLFAAHDPEDIYVVVGESSGVRNSEAAQVLVAPEGAGGLQLKSVFELLFQAGINSVLVEGGARVLGQCLEQGLADRLYLFQAPILMGSSFGRSWSEGLHISRMSEKITLRNQIVKRFGPDIMITGRLTMSKA